MPFSGKPRQLLGGCRFLEGPVWLRAGSPMAALARLPGPALVFSDLQIGRLLWWTPNDDHGLWREDSGGANGNALDPEGRLVTCEHGGRRVTRTEPDGTVTVLATHWRGRRLNSPNDVVVRSNGAVYFTDPPYGVQPEHREIDAQGVYRIGPGGEPELLAGELVKPNGLAFSPDERLLYVADTEQGRVRVYTTPADGQWLMNGQDLCEVPRPDGLRVDVEGNLYVAALDGVQVFDPDGRRLATLELPERPANLAFGGEDGRTLFICARTSLYACRTRLPGAAVAG